MLLFKHYVLYDSQEIKQIHLWMLIFYGTANSQQTRYS